MENRASLCREPRRELALYADFFGYAKPISGRVGHHHRLGVTHLVCLGRMALLSVVGYGTNSLLRLGVHCHNTTSINLVGE